MSCVSSATWPTLDLPVEAGFLPRELRVDYRDDAAVYSTLQDIEWGAEQLDWYLNTHFINNACYQLIVHVHACLFSTLPNT